MTRSVRVTPPDAGPAIETELKLRAPAGQWRRLLMSPLLRGVARGRTQRLAATYYDTPQCDLWRNRLALRVRREDGRWVQAVKGAGSVESGLHSRLELETALRGAHPDPSLVPRHGWTRVLHAPEIAAALVPVLRTEITRTQRTLAPQPGVLIEAALDRGLIRSGRRRDTVCELELELKQGPVSALFDLALQLATELPLTLEHRSKAERGYALFERSLAAPVKAVPVQLMPAMDAAAAFRVMTATALTQIHGNARGALGSADPEFLHQLRVGLRRLRSVFDLFKSPLGAALEPHATAVRALAAALNAARDWDVLVEETLPLLTDLPGAEALVAASARARHVARRKAKIDFKTIGYDLTMVALGRALVLPETTADAVWREPVRAAAARMLAERHARVLKRGRRLAQQSPAQLHRLRIAVKKLRYAVEFFTDLFQVKEMAVQRARLVKLQDILGLINDGAAVASLFASQANTSGWPIEAADAVLAWHEARAARQRGRLARAWRRFRAAPEPWRRGARRAHADHR